MSFTRLFFNINPLFLLVQIALVILLNYALSSPLPLHLKVCVLTILSLSFLLFCYVEFEKFEDGQESLK